MTEEEYKKKVAAVVAKMMKGKKSTEECVGALKKLGKSTEKATKALNIFHNILNSPSIKLEREIDKFYREAVKTNFPAQFRRAI